jgi:AraC-like DNA-binding protein
MSEPLRPPLSSHTLARGKDWGAWDVTCRQGPGDPRFEERHSRVSIAAVMQGSFQYRSATGSALLYPGAFLLGNAGSCYECGHDHGVGDRCVAFGFARPYFEEIAAQATGSSRFRFKAAMVPAVAATTRPLARVQAWARDGGEVPEELAVSLAEEILRIVSGRVPSTAEASPRDRRRVSEAMRYADLHFARPLDLDTLAGEACMSKYHFLRVFRRAAGVTPYQYVLNARMRHAAAALSEGALPVGTIALDAGFGDLSTFSSRFRRTFGTSPAAFRSRALRGRRGYSAAA